MDAIILCAGFGTRMYPLTEPQPKSLLKVAGKPVLDYLIDQLITCDNLMAIHIVVNQKFYEHFFRWSIKWKSQLQLHEIELRLYNNGVEHNEHRLGAIGDLAYALEECNLSSENILVIAGDNIFLFDIVPICQRFSKSPRNMLLAIKEHNKQRLRRMGVLQIGDDGKVIKFQEKPNNPTSSWVCPAFYLFTSDVLQLIKQYCKKPTLKDEIGYLLQHLVEAVDVFAFKVDGVRLDIGSLEDYGKADLLIAKQSSFKK